jgi:hypothetical protein
MNKQLILAFFCEANETISKEQVKKWKKLLHKEKVHNQNTKRRKTKKQ